MQKAGDNLGRVLQLLHWKGDELIMTIRKPAVAGDSREEEEP